MNEFRAAAAVLIALLVLARPGFAQPAALEKVRTQPPAESAAPINLVPTPWDPFPPRASGWGPEVGKQLRASRWAEDWTGTRATDDAPSFKAISVGGSAVLTLSAESRFRFDSYNNRQLLRGSDYEQGLFRGVAGADLRFNPNLRVYAEVATGQIRGRRKTATASLQNAASMQQLFVEASGHVDTTLLGAMLGRQEFADGPRQLISLSDGPNIHRTWTGVRLYAHGRRVRVGAFELRGTRLQRGMFDDAINNDERLRGLNASAVISADPDATAFIDPFWIHSENPAFRQAGRVGLDDRDTLGVRLWGRRGALSFDWTVAHQSGSYMHADISAWGVFAVQSWTFARGRWNPRLTAHIDVASGGVADGGANSHGFNPLYASSGYLGDGQFLSLSNLLMVAPGVSVSPAPDANVAMEYGYARRINSNDAAYAGGMRAYPGTERVSGHEVGTMLRVVGTWTPNANLTVAVNIEHFTAGAVLERARLQSGSYGNVSATFRY